MTRIVTKVSDGLTGLSAIIGCLALFFEVLVIMADVIGRYMGAPVHGARDLSQMAMILVVFGGMALCGRRGGHIALDVFENIFPDWLRRATDIAGALIGAGIFLAIAWTIYDVSKMSAMLNMSTNILNLPRAQFQWAISAFAVISALALLVRALEHALGIGAGDDSAGEPGP